MGSEEQGGGVNKCLYEGGGVEQIASECDEGGEEQMPRVMRYSECDERGGEQMHECDKGGGSVTECLRSVMMSVEGSKQQQQNKKQNKTKRSYILSSNFEFQASAHPRKSAPSSLRRSEAWIRAGTLQDCAADSEGQRQLQLSLGRTEANSRTLAGAAPLYLQPFSRDLAGLSQARLFPPAGAHFLRLRLGRGAAGSKAQVGWARLEFRAWQSGRGVWGRVVLVAAPATRARVSAARTLQGRVATFGDATWSGRLGCRGEGRGPAQELRRCWLRSEGVVPWPCWAQSCLLSAVPGEGDGTISRAR
nr:uncharacterized protein LOC103239367 [Chlorocebus sabaeus]